jgi:molybdopterin synthase sulfur carrier subunit
LPKVILSGSAGRQYTGGQSEIEVEATNFRRLVVELDKRFPGLGTQIDESMAIAIDGEIYQDSYGVVLRQDSEIVLIPKIGGG